MIMDQELNDRLEQVQIVNRYPTVMLVKYRNLSVNLQKARFTVD